GGGIGIFAGIAAGLAFAFGNGLVDSSLFTALIAGGTLIAGIGFLDDRQHVSPLTRAAVHFLAAALALALLGGLPSLELGGGELSLGAAGWVLGALGIVWLINLFNFMDGIDGIEIGRASGRGRG